MSDLSVGAVTASDAFSTGTTDEPIVENPGARLDRDAFLKLLVAQLRYQDPSSPMDPTQMIAQTSQLTMVDRLNEIADGIAASNASNLLAIAGSLVGKSITFTPPDGILSMARVESARIEGDGIVVTAGGFEIPADSIVSISSAPIPASGTGTSGT